MGIEVEQTHYTLLPVGEYPAIVADVEAADGVYGPQLKFTFNILGEHLGTTISAWATRSFNVKSKLYQWTQAMLGGGEIDPDYAFNSDAVLKRKVILTIIKKQGDKKPGEPPVEYNRISAIAPYKKPGAAPVKKVPPPPPDEDGPYDDEPPF